MVKYLVTVLLSSFAGVISSAQADDKEFYRVNLVVNSHVAVGKLFPVMSELIQELAVSRVDTLQSHGFANSVFYKVTLYNRAELFERLYLKTVDDKKRADFYSGQQSINYSVVIDSAVKRIYKIDDSTNNGILVKLLGKDSLYVHAERIYFLAYLPYSKIYIIKVNKTYSILPEGLRRLMIDGDILDGEARSILRSLYETPHKRTSMRTSSELIKYLSVSELGVDFLKN